mmetsp:Transcript_126/g.397  ORF Transcript_126/g.397 Transcript_126/m.397 type:complete len:1140 (+) Transcript_126:259-3678(+)
MGFFSKLKAKSRKKDKGKSEQTDQDQEQLDQAQDQDIIQDAAATDVASDDHFTEDTDVPYAAPDYTADEPRTPPPPPPPHGQGAGANSDSNPPPPPRPQRTTANAGPVVESEDFDELDMGAGDSYGGHAQIDGVPENQVRLKLEQFYEIYEPSKLTSMNKIMEFVRKSGLQRLDNGLLQKYGCCTGLGGLQGVNTIDSLRAETNQQQDDYDQGYNEPSAPPAPPAPPAVAAAPGPPPPPPKRQSLPSNRSSVRSTASGAAADVESMVDNSVASAYEDATEEDSEEPIAGRNLNIDPEEEARLRDSIRLPGRPSLMVDEVPASPSSENHVIYKSLKSALRARRLESLHEDLLACGVEEYTDLAKLDTQGCSDEVWGNLDYMTKKKLKTLANEAKLAAPAVTSSPRDGGHEADEEDFDEEASSQSQSLSYSEKRNSTNSAAAAALAMAAMQKLRVRKAASSRGIDAKDQLHPDQEEEMHKPAASSGATLMPPPPPPKQVSSQEASDVQSDDELSPATTNSAVKAPPPPPPPLPARTPTPAESDYEAGDDESEVVAPPSKMPGPPPPLPSRNSARMSLETNNSERKFSDTGIDISNSAQQPPPPPPPLPTREDDLVAADEVNSDVHAQPQVVEEIVEITDDEAGDSEVSSARRFSQDDEDDDEESEYEEGEVIYDSSMASKQASNNAKSSNAPAPPPPPPPAASKPVYSAAALSDVEDAEQDLDEPSAPPAASVHHNAEDADMTDEEDDVAIAKAKTKSAGKSSGDISVDANAVEAVGEEEENAIVEREDDAASDASPEMTEEERLELERQERFARQEERARREREALAAAAAGTSHGSAKGGDHEDTGSDAGTYLESDASPHSTPSVASRKYMSGIPVLGANDEMRALLERRQMKNREHGSEKTIMTESTAPGDGPCDNFRLDMTAATFNTCQCGFPKSQHSTSGGSAKTFASGSFRSGSMRFSQKFAAPPVPPAPSAAPSVPKPVKEVERQLPPVPAPQSAAVVSEEEERELPPVPGPPPPIPRKRDSVTVPKSDMSEHNDEQDTVGVSAGVSAAGDVTSTPTVPPTSAEAAAQVVNNDVEEHDGDNDVLSVEEVRAKVEAFYAKYNPEKLNSMDKIMRTFAGREQVLLDKLEKKYGKSV